jgi:glycosyl-4,4'-diaponeurosporenoate acyltransferase
MAAGDTPLQVLATAGLWLGWSLLVGALANRVPLTWLNDPAGGTASGRNAGSTRLYERWLAIRRWKPWIPDAGNALPGGIRKTSLARRDPAALRRLIAETRRAELVHWALWPAWLPSALWLPPAGVALNLLFATAFNLPCLLLQRFNRLRVTALLQRMGRQRPGGG